MTSSASRQTRNEAGAVPRQAKPDLERADAASMDPTKRHAMIAEAAFFLSEARGFTPSQELDNWLAAERDIEQRLSNPGH